MPTQSNAYCYDITIYPIMSDPWWHTHFFYGGPACASGVDTAAGPSSLQARGDKAESVRAATTATPDQDAELISRAYNAYWEIVALATCRTRATNEDLPGDGAEVRFREPSSRFDCFGVTANQFAPEAVPTDSYSSTPPNPEFLEDTLTPAQWTDWTQGRLLLAGLAALQAERGV